MFKNIFLVFSLACFTCFSAFSADNKEAEMEDPVTLEPITVPISLNCGHAMNIQTLRDIYKAGHRHCPLCRAKFNSDIISYQIFVRYHIFVRGEYRCLAFDVNDDDTIEMLYQKIEQRLGLPRVSARLFYDGRELRDDKMLWDYHVTNEKTIDLYTHLRDDDGRICGSYFTAND